MNVSKFFVSCFLAASLAFAQDSGTKDSTLAVFDKVRGQAYNPYATMGAATSVTDLLKTPSDIYEQRFFYISPTDSVGYAVFGLGGGSAMLSLMNNGDIAALVLGYATPAFGVALNYSVSKTWNSYKTTIPAIPPFIPEKKIETSQRITAPGDNIGLSFSLPLGSSKFYANGGWLTDKESWAVEVDGDETKLDYSTIDASVGFTGAFGSLGYDAHLGFVRSEGTYTNKDGDKAIDTTELATGFTTYLATGLGFDLGYAALQSEKARVIVGLNNSFLMIFLDEVKNVRPEFEDRKGDNIISFLISPNILGEVVLFDNLLAFAGAMHTLAFMAGNGDGNDDTKFSMLAHDGQTDTFVGIRYQRTNWALEAQVSANPFEALEGGNIFANFGGFIYF